MGRNFRNEIVWWYGNRATVSKSAFPKKHDIIFRYSFGDNFIYNQQYQPYKDPSMSRYNKVDVDGKRYAEIKRRRTNGEIYYGKTYPSEGAPVTDTWEISTLASTDSERLGYPTQKPEALLERIILSSSNA